MPPTNILQIIPDQAPGNANSRGLIDILPQLSPHGFRSVVISKSGIFDNKLRRLKLPHYQHNWGRRALFSHQSTLHAICARENISIVEVNLDHDRFYPALLAASLFGKSMKVVLGINQIPVTSWWQRKRLAEVLQRADKIITTSRVVKQQLQLEHGLMGQKVTALSNGVNLAIYNPDKVIYRRMNEFFARYSHLMHEQRPVILQITPINDQAATQISLEAIAILRELADRPLLCLFVGPASRLARKNFDRTVTKLQLEKFVRYVGEIDDMPAAYKNIDFVLNTTLTYPAASLPVMEAQACRKCVITNAKSIASDTIEHGKTGFLVNSNDPVLIAKALQRVLTLPKERLRSIESSAQQKIINKHTLEHAVEKRIRVYRSLVSAKTSQ